MGPAIGEVGEGVAAEKLMELIDSTMEQTGVNAVWVEGETGIVTIIRHYPTGESLVIKVRPLSAEWME